MAKSYHVTVYNTNKPDYEIDRYLTSQMRGTSVGDVKPSKQYLCQSCEEADELFEKLSQEYAVVCKFEGKHLLQARNKNK